MPYNQPVTLSTHVTVTVTAWGLGNVASHAADLQAVIDSFTAPLRGMPAPLPTDAIVPVLARVLRVSLTRPEDAQYISASDIGALMTAIWEVNGLGELAKKSLALQLRAQASLKEPLRPSP